MVCFVPHHLALGCDNVMTQMIFKHWHLADDHVKYKISKSLNALLLIDDKELSNEKQESVL